MRRPSGALASGGGALAKWENNFASIESGDIFRALKPAKMMIMAKHSRIAIIKSRKNGGTLLLLAAAAMHVMGASVSAQETPDFEAIRRSEEHTSELQSLMRLSYVVFCLKKQTLLNHKTTLLNYRK